MKIARNHNAIINQLLSWYEDNKRDMPWRNTRDPYKIWLSEVILQQTRVDQGLPYYLKFIQKYPTIKHLSEANIDEVLRLWQGLGYYSRARNLHKCSKTVSEKFGGHFPQERESLLKLPGIGPYTAAAIASFAFKKQEAVVDGNVIRVITRLYAIEEDISNHGTVKKISDIVGELIPKDNPDLFNQAIMEFGATFCMPKNPDCENCIFTHICIAKSMGLQKSIPMKKKRIKKRTRFFQYLIIDVGGKFLLQKRQQNDIWNGLFEFYLIESDKSTDFDELDLPDDLVQHNTKWEMTHESKTFKHILTHQNIMCRFIHIRCDNSYNFDPEKWEAYNIFSPEEIEQLPKPILIDKYLGEKIN